MREDTSEDLEVSAKLVRTTSCHCGCGNPTGTWKEEPSLPVGKTGHFIRVAPD